MAQTATDDSPYLTIDDLAERYQIPIQTVRYWRTQGNGPKGVRIGKYIRYHMTDVLAWERQLAEQAQ